jgi:outer membrane protein assembly factor BamB
VAAGTTMSLLAACASPATPTARASSAAPTTVPGAVVPNCGAAHTVNDEPVSTLALSAEGRVCWQVALTVPVENAHSFAAPILAGGRAFFDADSDVIAVDLASGRQLWRWSSGDPQRVGGAPGGTLMVAAADGVVVVTQGVDPGPQYVLGLDQRTGAVRWRRSQPDTLDFSGPDDSGDGGTVFTAYDGQVIEVLNDADGTIRWSRPNPPLPGGRRRRGRWALRSDQRATRCARATRRHRSGERGERQRRVA